MISNSRVYYVNFDEFWVVVYFVGCLGLVIVQVFIERRFVGVGVDFVVWLGYDVVIGDVFVDSFGFVIEGLLEEGFGFDGVFFIVGYDGFGMRIGRYDE